MSLSADQLTDRTRLKKDVKRWRMQALLFLVATLLAGLQGKGKLLANHEGHIARIDISGFIGDDIKREAMLASLADDKQVKAVLVRLDSPGGTALGGEELYRQLKALSAKKPVVGLMRTACTSACYMAALGTTHMMALSTSITGSIGVLLEMAEFTELAKKLGVEPITVKSGALKATPSLVEKFTAEQRSYIQAVVDASFHEFMSMVKARRELSENTLSLVVDGRIFTGRQAHEHQLIDAMGSEPEAREWLAKQHQISIKMEVVDVEPKKQIKGVFGDLQQHIRGLLFGRSTETLDGLQAIWQPVVK